MRKLLTAILLALALPLAVAAQDGPAAVVVKITGTVQIRSGEAAPAPATVGTRLAIGDQVIPGSGGEATVLSRAGQKQVFTEATTIAAPDNVDRGDMATRTLGVLAQAATSNARSVPNRQGMIRPIPGEPTPVTPRNGIRTLNTRPTLIWMAVEGATGYTVQIRRAGQPPMRFQSADTTFALPDDLEEGHTYYWTVGAGRRTAREDSVVIASAEQRQLVHQSMQAITELGFDPQDDGQLLALIVYVDMGMHYEALEALNAIEETGASLGVDTLLLKGEVLDALGRVDEAREAFDAADRLLRG